MNPLLRGLLNLPPQASTYAESIDVLHYFVISATMGGATFVFLLAIYYLIRYRRREPFPTTAHVQTPVPAEVLIIGSLLSLFLAFWVVGTIQYNHMMTPPPDALPVYVTAKQWMWKFSYPDGSSSINVLTVPAHRPIKLVMTSRDVIHSFYVPAFRMKHDVVPGRYYAAWFEAKTPGQYDIECAEYCGVSHSRMMGKVDVLSEEEYGRRLDGRATRGEGPPGTDLAAEGRDVAVRRGCLNCHTVDGQPHIGPTWAALYRSDVKLADGSTVKADEAYLTRSMMEPLVQIVDGYKPVMPTYQGILSEPDVAALVEYIRSLESDFPRSAVTLPHVQPLGSGQPREPQP